jgi:taurine dioxygenase
MTFTTRPIDPSRPFGRIVENLGLDALRDEATRQDLRRLWADHGLLVFRGETDPRFHLELSRVFGPLEPHTVRELRVEDQPELYRLRHSPEIDPWLYDVGGEIKGGWVPWHFDLAFVPLSNRGAMLRSITLPRHGGQTGFIDGVEAYDILPEALRARLDGIEVIYRMEVDMARNRFSERAMRKPIRLVRDNGYTRSMESRQRKDYPPVTFPAVMAHPDTGRKLLHVSPLFAMGIAGMDEAAGLDLLGEIVDHITADRLPYYHEWQGDELVLWDNWRMLHCACGVPDGETREMHRTTISAPREIGRYLAAQPA